MTRSSGQAGRSLYGALLSLHPRGFRQEFGREMLLVFDEAVASYGTLWLLGDALVSLVRQRLLRWPEETQAAAAPESLCLLAGTYPAGRPPHLTAGKIAAAVLLSLLPASSAAIQAFSPAPAPVHRHRVVSSPKGWR